MTAVAEREHDRRARPSRGLRYAPGLDGIRAIAVTAVLLFHGDVPGFQGGFLGVDVFFVLSGYLITSLLLKELRLTQRVAFARFYLHRARRLLPALFLTLLGCAVLALTVAPDAAERLRGDIVSSFFYVTNWWYVIHDLSYFEAIGRPPLLQHLWTLAIEEQFYLIWPAVAYGLYRWRGKARIDGSYDTVGRHQIATFALLGALVSTALMTFHSITMDAPATHSVSRIYFGTDTHAMGLLLGAAMATFWRMDYLQDNIDAAAKRVLTIAGGVGLVGIAAFVVAVGSNSVWLYRGGFLLLSFLVVLVIAPAVHPALRFGTILGWGPMHYLGTRSYGLYLYHWPIFMVLRPGIDLPWTGFPVLALRLAATLAVAELSYRLVEMPVRHGALGRLWKGARERYGQRAWAVAGAATVTLGLLLGSISTGLAAATPASAIDGLNGITSVGDNPLSEEPALPQPGTSSPPLVTPSPPPAKPSASPTPAGSGPPAVTGANFPPGTGVDLAGGPVTVVGDSVLLGSHVAVERVLPQARVDAAISRQAGAVFARISDRLASKRLAPVVVIHTGTNGEVPWGDLAALLTTLSDRTRIVLVNTHVPRPWQDANNATLQRAADQFPNVVLADWATASQGHREYFVADGVHLSQAGGRAYAAVIAQALGGCRNPVCPR